MKPSPNGIRRAIAFLLGVAVIIDALARDAHVVAELIVGLVLLGYSPFDTVINAIAAKYTATAEVAKGFGREREPLPPSDAPAQT